jgi:lipopolysaccharide/colanic/teichoic acid biosynthesis glycosyltransferase
LFSLRLSYVPSAYCVKPGLSGYSQVVLKKNSNLEEKAKNDSFYAQNFSFFFLAAHESVARKSP